MKKFFLLFSVIILPLVILTRAITLIQLLTLQIIYKTQWVMLNKANYSSSFEMDNQQMQKFFCRYAKTGIIIRWIIHYNI